MAKHARSRTTLSVAGACQDAQQDAGEHRHRALAIGDALREAQPAKELGSCGNEFKLVTRWAVRPPDCSASYASTSRRRGLQQVW
jgi:hypothetical protein